MKNKVDNYVEQPLPGADPTETPLEGLVRVATDAEKLEAKLDRDDFYGAIGKHRGLFPAAIIKKEK